MTTLSAIVVTWLHVRQPAAKKRPPGGPPGAKRWRRRSWRPPPTCSPSAVRPRRRSATSPPGRRSTTGWCFRRFGAKDQLVGAVLDHLGTASTTLRRNDAEPAELQRSVDRHMRVMARTVLDGIRWAAADAFPQRRGSCSTRCGRATTPTTERAAGRRQCPCAAIRLAAVRAFPASRRPVSTS